jgi:hypothetical protein
LSNIFSRFEAPAFLFGTPARLLVMSAVVFLVVGYIVQIGVLTTSGYEIATLEKQVESLSNDTEKLTSTLASYQAIGSVEKRLEPGSMVPVIHIEHIRTSIQTAVAP